jgi:hypothetical protein
MIFSIIFIIRITSIGPEDCKKSIETNDQTKEPILYSSLNFGQTKSVLKPYDENSRKKTIDIIPFSEDILGDADMVCKVTVINTEKKTLCYCRELYDVYEVRIDKIYYSQKEIKEGEVIKIQNFNFFNCTLAPLNSEIINDHQYILSIRSSALATSDPETIYGIVYPYAHPIEVTKDNEYVFNGGWKSLINENTFDVILDNGDFNCEDLFDMDKIKLRKDEGFEGDLIALIQSYKDKELKKINIDEQDVMQVVWSQLDLSDLDFIRDGSTLNKTILSEATGIDVRDRNYLGKEVYIINFTTTNGAVPNNLIVYASLDDYKVVGYGLVD